jgi:hypothetical protein
MMSMPNSIGDGLTSVNKGNSSQRPQCINWVMHFEFSDRQSASTEGQETKSKGQAGDRNLANSQ